MAVETVLASLATILLLGIVCGLPFGAHCHNAMESND